MYKVGDWAKTCEQEAVSIRKGTRVLIANPDWNGDRPETQFNMWIETDQDYCIWTCSGSERMTGKIVEIVPPT